MSLSAEILRQLHRIHRQRADLNGRMERGPKQLAAKQSAVDAAQKEVDEMKERQQKTRMLADERQLQLKEREDRVADLRGKLNACNNNKEYQTLKEQIAADVQANSVLSDEILELLEKIDQIAASISEADVNLKKADEELQKTRQAVAAERQLLENELVRVNDELGTVEAKLPADFRSEYERLARKRGEEALAPVDGESCGGCNQLLSPQTFNNLYMNKPVFCSSCGSLLYLPEDRTPGK